MKRRTTLALALLMLMLCSSITSMADDSHRIRADYPLTKLTNHVYVLYGPLGEPSKENQGFRNNVVIVLTNAGVVVMDVGTSVYVGRMVLEKIRTLTDKPVVAVFNSHVHGDHWLGNQAFKEANPDIKIYGHANMIKLIAEGADKLWIDRFNSATDNATEGTVAVAPNVAVKDGDVIKIGELDFHVIATGPGHSTSDIMIRIPQENVLFTGDNVRDHTVAISIASFKGNLKAVDRILKTDTKIFIPGHGKAGGKEVVLAYRRFLDTLKSTVAKLYDTGMQDYQMKPAVVKALAEFKDWVRFKEHIGRLVSLAYLEVEKEAFN